MRVLGLNFPQIPYSGPLVPFLASLFFIIFADSLMAYAFPVFVESTLKSTTLMGIVVATSSMAGITCDLLFPKLLERKSWKTHLIAAILIASSFPLLSLMGIQSSILWFFIIGSVIWGIYYELLFFSQQHFVVTKVSKPEFSKVWGLIALFSSFSLIIGPILASQFIEKTYSLFVIVGSLQLLALMLAFLINNGKIVVQNTHRHITFFKELQIWSRLAPRVISVVVVGTLTKCVDATFWTIGALFGIYFFSETVQLGTMALDHSFAWLPLIMYQVPGLLGSLLLVKLHVTFHKKYLSELLLMLAGVCLIPLYFVGHTPLVLVLFFLAGFANALAAPLNQAVYSDLIKRSKGYGEDVVGLSQANASLAYILTPLLVGFSVEQVSFELTFTFLGILLVFSTAVLLLITPKKIHLPEKI